MALRGRPPSRPLCQCYDIHSYVTTNILRHLPIFTKQQNSTGSVLATSYGVVHGHNSEERSALGVDVLLANTYIRVTGEGSTQSQVAQTFTLAIGFVPQTRLVTTPHRRRRRGVWGPCSLPVSHFSALDR